MVYTKALANLAMVSTCPTELSLRTRHYVAGFFVLEYLRMVACYVWTLPECVAVNCINVVSHSFCRRGLVRFPFACDIQRSQRAFLLFFPCAGVRKDLMWPFLPPVFVVFFGPGFGRTSRGRSSPLFVCCSGFAASFFLEKVGC